MRGKDWFQNQKQDNSNLAHVFQSHFHFNKWGIKNLK